MTELREQQFASSRKAPGNNNRFASPRPVNRSLHLFYEPLVLLRIIEPARGSQEHHSLSDATPEGFQDTWCKFLDHLSVLCDYDCGGKAVSSIAAEETPSGPTFWLAANGNSAKKSEPHLSWILGQLESVHRASTADEARIEEEIASQSISFSRNKVAFYSRQLCNEVSKVMIIAEGETPPSDINLLDDLQLFEKLRDDHCALCAAALRFREQPSFKYLCQKIPTTPEPSSWKTIRHYIGRLGYWAKAAKTVVRVAKDYPRFFVSFNVKTVDTPSTMPLPPARAKSTLEGTVQRMFGANETAKAEQLLGILRFYRDMNLEEMFVQEYKSKNFKPQIHAEMLLLEHFYLNELKFVENVRYIGCSKPSCYCCDLYMGSHPGMFVKRPCHGNLWTNWALPVDIRGNAPRTTHAKAILRDMIKRVRLDVKSQIESKEPRRARKPDSTTGISAYLGPSDFQPEALQTLVEDLQLSGEELPRSILHRGEDDSNEVSSFRSTSPAPSLTNLTALTTEAKNEVNPSRPVDENGRWKPHTTLRNGLVAMEDGDSYESDEGGVMLRLADFE